MMGRLRRRRIMLAILVSIGAVLFLSQTPSLWYASTESTEEVVVMDEDIEAIDTLAQLPVKGRAPKTGYSRTQFGSGWVSVQGCDMRNTILARDMTQVEVDDECRVIRGILHDPYTDKQVNFVRGPETSQAVQIDHVVALSNAWQTGAQQLAEGRRVEFANDPLNLIAVEGKANQQKSDSDAATWLPSHKSFRCQYVARQIAVKKKYNLWVVSAEKEAMQRILRSCPGQAIPHGSLDVIQ